MRITVKIYSIPEAAEYLGLHPNTVRVHVKSGRLPAQRVGREYAILEPDLIWFAGLDRGPGRPPREGD